MARSPSGQTLCGRARRGTAGRGRLPAAPGSSPRLRPRKRVPDAASGTQACPARHRWVRDTVLSLSSLTVHLHQPAPPGFSGERSGATASANLGAPGSLGFLMQQLRLLHGPSGVSARTPPLERSHVLDTTGSPQDLRQRNLSACLCDFAREARLSVNNVKTRRPSSASENPIEEGR